MNDYLLSDEFVSKLAEKEEAAFRLLFDHFYRALCFYSAKIICNEEEAKDIVQDVFVNFYEQDLSIFSNFKAIKTYLYASIQNRSLNYLRDLNTRERNYRQLNLGKEVEESVICQQIHSEVIAEIFEAIEELPERCRTIFKMFYVEGLEEKAIAEQLNVSVNTIKTQKLRAKLYLKENLGELFTYAVMLFSNL